MKMESISISVFKATCLAVLHKVQTTGEPVLVTRRGVPIAEVFPPSPAVGEVRKLGVLADRGWILGDIVTEVSDPSDWEVLRD